MFDSVINNVAILIKDRLANLSSAFFKIAGVISVMSPLLACSRASHSAFTHLAACKDVTKHIISRCHNLCREYVEVVVIQVPSHIGKTVILLTSVPRFSTQSPYIFHC